MIILPNAGAISMSKEFLFDFKLQQGGYMVFLLLGILKPEVTVKYIAVFIIFFNSGISLKSEVRYFFMYIHVRALS